MHPTCAFLHGAKTKSKTTLRRVLEECLALQKMHFYRKSQRIHGERERERGREKKNKVEKSLYHFDKNIIHVTSIHSLTHKPVHFHSFRWRFFFSSSFNFISIRFIRFLISIRLFSYLQVRYRVFIIFFHFSPATFCSRTSVRQNPFNDWCLLIKILLNKSFGFNVKDFFFSYSVENSRTSHF